MKMERKTKSNLLMKPSLPALIEAAVAKAKRLCADGELAYSATIGPARAEVAACNERLLSAKTRSRTASTTLSEVTQASRTSKSAAVSQALDAATNEST